MKTKLAGDCIAGLYRKIMFNQDLYNVTFVRDFMTTPPTIVDVTVRWSLDYEKI